MGMLKGFLFALLGSFVSKVSVHGQGQSGSISIDCGLSGAGYFDEFTGIYYTSDAGFIDTGINSPISPEFNTSDLQDHYRSVRSFPQGRRNCYTLKPEGGKGYKYLIRASFMYGNYDAKRQVPEFDLHLGVNKMDSVKLDNASHKVYKAIIHVPSSDNIYVCLVNTGLGTPFMSTLELRLLNYSMYPGTTESLSLLNKLRLDYGSTTHELVRYVDDRYDRLWFPATDPDRWASLSTSFSFDSAHYNPFEPPPIVMMTAITPLQPNDSIKISWKPDEDPTSQIYFYMYFAELEELKENQFREFNINLNGDLWHGPFVPKYLNADTIYHNSSEAKFDFSIIKTENSTHPPIINAIEIYMVRLLLLPQTDQKDVEAMMNIKSSYGLMKNWQGDPCAPKTYLWDGLNCDYNGFDSPRIVSLNLSSNGLTGEISSGISNLKALQYLDLSNNSLTGSVPDFQLPLLRALNLTGNKLSGSIPMELVERSKNGSLLLSVDNNLNLVSSNSSQKMKNVAVPLVATLVASLFVLLTVLATLWYLRRRKQEVKEEAHAESNKNDGSLELKKWQYTYSEVLSITDNFKRIVGKGGSGTVYHGYLGDTQVAVKMLSPSSFRGYEVFQAEAKLLLRVHHRNLTSLVGYCNEGTNMGLIYEYMANGDLRGHLSRAEGNRHALSWETRLQIAVDAAQGVEYLHSGCKPLIIHRDVKSNNILLNEEFRAKLADFGVSRDFPFEGDSHVSTEVIGTPGYLDPEYYSSNKLSEKSDVFSFGVVLLEIITGRPVTAKDSENAHIIEWVSVMLEKGDIRIILDPRLQGDFDINSAWKAVELAMICVSPTSIKRPTMNEVVMELKHCLAIEVARTKEGRDMESKDPTEMITMNSDADLGPLAR